MAATAGMVVTEMNTPTSVAAFDSMMERAPAVLAMSATTALKPLGRLMNDVRMRW